MISTQPLPAETIQKFLPADPFLSLPAVDAVTYVVEPVEADRRAIGRILQGPNHCIVALSSCAAFEGCTISLNGCAVVEEREWRLARIDGLQFAGLPVVVTSSAATVRGAVAAIKAGACNYLGKPFEPDLVREAVDKALALGAEERAARARRADARKRLASLSGRENEVMRQVVEGAANKQVAARLGLSEKTIEVYRSRVMKKFGVQGIAELVRAALLAETPVFAAESEPIVAMSAADASPSEQEIWRRQKSDFRLASGA